MKKSILAQKIGNLSGLSVGGVLHLDVGYDRKENPVFIASIHNLDPHGAENPSMRIIHPSCCSGITLAVGEVWEATISKMEVSGKSIRASGKDRRVIYIFINGLKRIEEKRIYFWDGKICCDVISGSSKVVQESVPATMKMKKVLDNGRIRNVGEISVAGRVVMRTDEGLLDEKGFVESQSAMLRGGSIFNLSAYKRRLQPLTKGQRDTFGKLYVSWDNLKTMQAESEGMVSASIESLTKQVAKSLASMQGLQHPQATSAR